MQGQDCLAATISYIIRKALPTKRTGGFGSTEKRVSWQIAVKDQRPSLKLQVNGIKIEDLMDTRADITIISQKSWNSNFKRFIYFFLEFGKLSQIKTKRGMG